MSFLAYAKHCNARRTIEGVLSDLVLVPGPCDIPDKLALSGLAAKRVS
jgi:hypothetical protein